MSTLFGSKTPPAPPPAPTIGAAQADANAAQLKLIQSGAVGQQQTVLTDGLVQPTVQKGATVLGGGNGSSAF